MMTPSPRAEALIKSYEQCRLRAYMPTPNDRPTIGWGTTGKDVTMGLVWTQAQADDRFSRDLATFSHGVNTLIGSHPTTQGQFDALVSFAYNIGVQNLSTSTLLRKHNAGDYAGAAAEFARWNKQKGQVLNGLTKRRAAEAGLYKS